MERSKLLIWIMVIVAAIVIVWRVGFYPTEAALKGEGAEPNAAGASVEANEPNKPLDVKEANEPNKPPDVKEANEPNKPPDVKEANEPGKPDEQGGPPREFGQMRGLRGPRDRGQDGPPGDANKPGEPNAAAGKTDQMESVNLKDVELKSLLDRLADWTGKAIVPSDEAMKIKVTIYAKEKLPRKKALELIYGALLQKGFVAEQTDGVIYLKALASAKLGQVPTVPADQPLAAIENKEQVVQRFFTLKNYSPTKMGQVVQPLIAEHGHLSADENSRSLLVIDTVANLMRIEGIIQQFDVPEAEGVVTEYFVIEYGDPSEIVQVLRTLIGEGSGSSRFGRSFRSDRGDFNRGGPPQFDRGPTPSPPTPSSGAVTSTSGAKGTASSVVIGSGTIPVVLIPEPRRKWIIAKASASDMKQIGEWIKKLDKQEPVQSEYEVIALTYADPREVENSINEAFSNLPGTELRPSVMVQPLQEAKQVIVFGRKDLRDMVKKMIEEVDLPPGEFETRHFQLKYADPDQVKTSLEELFSDSTTSRSRSSYGFGYDYGYSPYSSRGRTGSSTGIVKVISYATLKQVTVIASPDKMKEIAKQIEDWDKPLNVEEVKPRIIELQNSDPVQMADLLSTLFTEQTSGSRGSFLEMYFGIGQDKKKIVGPLYGQLTFEAVPATKKIIVISKIPEAYDVVEQLVMELDRQEMGEVPRVIQLRYADPEDLAERLNAMFLEEGQQARIRMTKQGLSAYSVQASSTTSSSSSSGGGGNQGSNQTSSQGDSYTPPWSGAGARRGTTAQTPISNVIGRIRFVPNPSTKSILVLSPKEFMDEIEATIKLLDVPGKQVMIKAVILVLDRAKTSSIGAQLATNPAAFGSLSENAIMALSNVTSLGTHGSATGLISPTSNQPFTAKGSGSVIGIGTDVYALIDFLVKKTDAKILNQQTLWTKDNEEANFFKGSQVAFLKGTTTAAAVGTTQSIEFDMVGMTLRARPSITPEDNVDMIVNVNISQLTSELVNQQPVRDEMDTTTNMIVQNGQTLLLGGILFQTDSKVERKLPGIGDVPLIGGLFRHNATIQSSSEMLVFITPFVVGEWKEPVSEAAKEQIELPRKQLDEVRKQLESTMEKLDGQSD